MGIGASKHKGNQPEDLIEESTPSQSGVTVSRKDTTQIPAAEPKKPRKRLVTVSTDEDETDAKEENTRRDSEFNNAKEDPIDTPTPAPVEERRPSGFGTSEFVFKLNKYSSKPANSNASEAYPQPEPAKIVPYRQLKSKAPVKGATVKTGVIPGMEALGTEYATVCPWESFGGADLNELAQYGII